MIPHVLFLYWGGRKLSWLRYLTVLTFNKFNPDWQIKVYYPIEPTIDNTWHTGEQDVLYKGKDWFGELKNIPNVTLYAWDMTAHGFVNEATEVHKSDVFRLWALYREGGVFSDFDIIFYKPIDLKKYRTIICFEPVLRYYSIGLIGSVKGDLKFADMLDVARHTPTVLYQSLGAKLWNMRLSREVWWDRTVWNLPMSAVYPYDSEHISDIYASGRVTHNGFGLHWYGGHPISGEWENKITPKTHDFDNRLCNLVKEVV